jgi:hypothetical protein
MNDKERIAALEQRISNLESRENRLGPQPKTDAEILNDDRILDAIIKDVKERTGNTLEIGEELTSKRNDAEKTRRGIEILKQKSEQHGAAVCTTDGRPPDPDYAELGNAPRPVTSNGQHESYYVLCAEERAKGFVRPVRHSYRHVKCGTVTYMGQALAETYARDPHFYGATMCCGCGTHFPLVNPDGVRQFIWINEDGISGEGLGE